MANGTLQLSAADLRALTKWPDTVIEDYLNMTRTVADVIQVINIVVEEVALISADPAAANIANLAKVQADLAQVSASVLAVGQQAGAQIQRLANRIECTEQQDAMILSALGMASAEASKNAAIAQDLLQLAASNAAAINQLASTVQVALSRIENLEQITG
jgi:predicted ATP-dependent serine protease